ncbi:single-stranded DNA-binding protein [bacterium]|nr:single-stranded DNA-binding protein [bacterium]
MSRGTLNKAVLIGRLGKDPDVHYTKSGIPISSFSIATNNVYKGKDGNMVEQTDWHKVVTWRKLAEISGQYLKKGSLVCVEGQLKTRSWDDKDGVKRYMTEIIAETMQMLSSKKGVEQQELLTHEQANDEPVETDETETPSKDDLPF